MAKRLTLTQAQDRLIKRVVEAHQGHQKRVLAAARKQLFAWAIAGGYTQDEAIVVCSDACDMLSLALKEDDLAEDAVNIEQTVEQKMAAQTTTNIIAQSSGTTNKDDRKSFWLVEGGKATAAAQDAEFDGNDSVLVYARTAFEARVIAEAYGDELIGIDNVEADNGKDVISAVFAPSEDTLEGWIQHYLTSDNKEVVDALMAIAPAGFINNLLARKLVKAVDDHGSVEISEGVFLHTAQNLQDEQESWDEEDGSNDADFSCCPYWVVTNDGHIISIDDTEGLSRFFESYGKK